MSDWIRIDKRHLVPPLPAATPRTVTVRLDTMHDPARRVLLIKKNLYGEPWQAYVGTRHAGSYQSLSDAKYHMLFHNGPPPGDPFDFFRHAKNLMDALGMGGMASAPDAARLAPLDPAEGEVFLEILREGCRTLARKWHPDAGGSAEQMTKLNLLREKLRQMYGGF